MTSVECRVIAAAALLLAAGAAAADVAAELKACAGITREAGRLACFDALARRSAAGTLEAAAPVAPVAKAEPAQEPPRKPEDFGKGRKKKPVEPRPSISARVVGTPKEWRKGTTFTLDNGQVWRAIGDEQGYYPNVPENPEVTITESVFGAFWLEIKAIDRKVKVKRVS